MDFPEFYKELEAEIYGAGAKLMGLQFLQLELRLGKTPSRSFRPVKSAEILWQFWTSYSLRVSLAHDGETLARGKDGTKHASLTLFLRLQMSRVPYGLRIAHVLQLGETYYLFMTATQTTNNNSIKSILEKEKLNGSKFLDWYRNMRIVLRNEQKLHHLEEALPEAPPATATAAVRNAYTCRVAEQQEVACLMLAAKICSVWDSQVVSEPVRNSKTAEEILAKERERKARTTLLMALPEDHLAKFHKMTDAKEMWEAIKSRFGGNDESKKMQKFQSLLSQLKIHGAGISTEDANQKFLRSLPSAWSQVSLIMRTKPGVDSLSFDDLYNNLRVFESDVKGSTASSSSTQNMAFVSENTSSTNDVSTAYGVSNSSGHNSQYEQTSSYSLLANQSSCPQLDHEDLEQLDEFDLEEMDLKWQVAMISMRMKKFYKKTGRKLQFDAKEPVGFDKTKVECYNCHKTGHFARECRTKGNQDSKRRDAWNSGNKDKENGRRSGKQEDSKALVTIDGEGVDWTSHSEEEEDYALMACNSSGSDTEVISCLKECKESYAELKKLYDEQRAQLSDASIEIQAYTQALKKVEAQLVAHQQSQLWYEEKIRFMKIDLDDKTDVLTYHKKLLAEAEKEKEDLKAKVEKWHNSSKNLGKLLNTQMSANDKFGLGYGDYRYDGILSYENEVLQSVFINKESDLENQPLYDRFVIAEGMHVVPPPMTGNYMPSGPDIEIDYSQFTYGPKHSQPSESETQTSDFDTCESNISVETPEFVTEPVVNEPKVVSQPKVWSDAPIIEEYESDSEDEHVSLPTEEQETPSFANKQVKTPRETVKNQFTHSKNPKVDKKGLGYGFVTKACFVCGSLSHLIRDCDFHEKRMAKQAELNNRMRKKSSQREIRTIWNNVQRVNHKNQFVPTAVLTRTGKIPVNTARASGTNNVSTARHNLNRQAVPTNAAMKVNTVKPIVNNARPKGDFHKSVSPFRKSLNRTTALRTNFSYQKVNTAEDYPYRTLQNKGIVDSGCSRHMTGNKAYLAKYQDFNGGPVAFGESKGYITCKGKIKTGKLDFEDVFFVKELQHFNLFSVSQMCDKKNKVLFTDTECLVLSPEFKLPDENQVLLRIPTQNNMYSFNLENIIPSGGIKEEYSNARTLQQNEVAERKNRTLIEAARTMLADSFLPNTFWAEAVSTACYVLNRVLVTKPQNKTPYELITGKIPIISYIRPFGCHVTILNTIDHLGKFEGKSDEGFLVGYSLQSKAFRVYNLETKIVEENLHITFLENKPNVAGKGPTWLFDLDYLTDSMNYQPVRSENQANKHAGPQEANQNAVKSSKAGEEPTKHPDFQKEFAQGTEDLLLQAGDAKASSTNIVNTASTLVSTTSPYGGLSFTDLTNTDQDDSEIPALEEIYDNPTDGIFTNSSYDDEGAVADFTNLEPIVNVSPIPTSRINSIHPSTPILGDPQSAVQTRRKVTKSSRAHAFIHKVWILVDFPYGKKAIGTKWVYRNKKDERGVVVRNKARLVARGHRQEEGIYYDDVFAPVARIEAIRIFLAFGSYMGFIVYQMDVKSTFMYGKIDEEVYVSQPLDEFYGRAHLFLGLQVKQKEDGIFISQDKYFAEILKKFDFVSVKTASTPIETQKPLVKDEEASDVDVHLYRSMIGSLMYLTASRPDIMFVVCACSRFQVNPKTSHLSAVKRIFRYLKGNPKMGLWYPRESSFDMEAYSDSDYARENLDRKSTTGEAEYVTAANCCGQVL
ncbi:retrovirus-related pol polyprotein from transposon TNT 1-94 [Tanacetum coccineum]